VIERLQALKILEPLGIMPTVRSLSTRIIIRFLMRFMRGGGGKVRIKKTKLKEWK
jgi:hypothetical protein